MVLVSYIFRATALNFRAGRYSHAKPLNPKTINSDENVSKITESNYTLYGLGIFAIFIMILFLLRRKNDKNEFGWNKKDWGNVYLRSHR